MHDSSHHPWRAQQTATAPPAAFTRTATYCTPAVGPSQASHHGFQWTAQAASPGPPVAFAAPTVAATAAQQAADRASLYAEYGFGGRWPWQQQQQQQQQQSCSFRKHFYAPSRSWPAYRTLHGNAPDITTARLQLALSPASWSCRNSSPKSGIQHVPVLNFAEKRAQK